MAEDRPFDPDSTPTIGPEKKQPLTRIDDDSSPTLDPPSTPPSTKAQLESWQIFGFRHLCDMAGATSR